MPELLIFAIEAVHPEGFRRYDVVDARPDGHPWSAIELEHKRFRLIKWPALDMGVCKELMWPLPAEWGIGPLGLRHGLQLTHLGPRRSYLDWDHPAAPLEVAAHIAAPRRGYVRLASPGWIVVKILRKREPIPIEREVS